MTGPEQLDHLHRHAERGVTERDRLEALLDEQFVGTLGTVVDGMPWAVPMLYARDGDRILLHGSTGAGALRHVAEGAPATFTVTTVDALVVAATTFDSSANYRSAVLRGTLTNLSDRAKWSAMDRISEHLIPGRTSEVRGMTRKELAATLAMSLPIEDGSWVMKCRDGLPSTNEESEAEPDVWTGVVPRTTSYGEPVAAPWSTELPVPPSVQRLADRA